MREQHKQLVTNMFIINCKNYNEISGEKINKLAAIAEKISKKHKIQIALALLMMQKLEVLLDT